MPECTCRVVGDEVEPCAALNKLIIAYELALDAAVRTGAIDTPVVDLSPEQVEVLAAMMPARRAYEAHLVAAAMRAAYDGLSNGHFSRTGITGVLVPDWYFTEPPTADPEPAVE